MNGLEDDSARRQPNGFTPVMDDCPIPLKVAIVGAGIGGLMAAIGLRHQGHEVNVCSPQSTIQGIQVSMLGY